MTCLAHRQGLLQRRHLRGCQGRVRHRRAAFHSALREGSPQHPEALYRLITAFHLLHYLKGEKGVKYDFEELKAVSIRLMSSEIG